MNKTLRKRVSGWVLLIVIGGLGLFMAAAMALQKPLPEYLVAKEILIPGKEMRAEFFEIQQLDLGPLQNLYLTARDAPEIFTVTDTVLEGELLPNRAVSTMSHQSLTTVVLNPSLPVGQSVAPGSWVQIWRTVSRSDGFLGEQLVSRSQVISISKEDSLVSERDTFVEVLVTQQQASLIIESISSELDIFLLVASSK